MSATAIDVRDQATPQLRQLIAKLQPARINPVVGRAGVNALRKHFYALESSRANKMGGKRTHFWSQAAKGTKFDVLPDGVLLSVSQVGVRQRFQGGEIRAKNVKYLTIPARVEAYGRRAREFHNLRFAITDKGPALVEAMATSLKRGKKGYKGISTSLGNTVYYWLRKRVNQDGDPTVLPTNQELSAAINKDLESELGGARGQ